MDDAGRQELQDDMRTLLEATGRLCAMDGSEDHEVRGTGSDEWVRDGYYGSFNYFNSF